MTVPIHLVGVPTDIHSSFLRGAAMAPARIRSLLFSDHSNLASERGAEIHDGIDLVDEGDLALNEAAGDDAIIRGAISAIVAAGGIPLALGGDHMISFPIVAAIAAARGPVDILHFDAHPDLYDDFDGDPLSHASPFARIMEAGHARRLVQVGIRTLNRHCREQAERFGVEIIEARAFRPGCIPSFAGPLYVSIDMDGFDPAFAPGVSHVEPGGLSARDVIDALLAIQTPVCGADIVELNPSRDVNDMTGSLAAKLVKELAALATEHPAL